MLLTLVACHRQPRQSAYADIIQYQQSQLDTIKARYQRGEITREQAEAMADEVTMRAHTEAEARAAGQRRTVLICSDGVCR